MTWIADRGRAFPILYRLNESAFRFSESGSQQSIPSVGVPEHHQQEGRRRRRIPVSNFCLSTIYPTIAPPGSLPPTPPPLNKFNLMFQFFNEQRDSSVTRLIKTSSIISSRDWHGGRGQEIDAPANPRRRNF